jgi:hypothetical protein
MRRVAPKEYTQNEGDVLNRLVGTVSAGEIDLG